MKKINTFIIPVLNNYEGLNRLLRTLKKYTPQNYNVIVIDNGYSLGLLEREKHYGKIVVNDLKRMVDIWIDPVRNLGFGKAMNQGIKLATTEFVTIANDDVEIIYEGWWEEIMEKFKEEEDLGGFNPHSPCNKSASGDRHIQYDYKEEYTKEDIIKMKEIFCKEREYIGCCTYFTICRKKMFDEIGLFDESFGLGSGEDYDLCVRAQRAGYKIKGGSTTMVFHYWGITKDNMPPAKEGEKGISNYDLIAGGNQNLTNKWGFHCDEVQRQLKSGIMTEEQAEELKGGWSVAGAGGSDEPLDQDKKEYKNKKWFVEVEI